MFQNNCASTNNTIFHIKGDVSGQQLVMFKVQKSRFLIKLHEITDEYHLQNSSCCWLVGFVLGVECHGFMDLTNSDMSLK